MKTETLDWDSKFFKLKIGKVDSIPIEIDLDFLKVDFDLLYLFHPSNLTEKQILKLEQKFEVLLVDIKEIYSKVPLIKENFDDYIKLLSVENEISQDLLSLALSSGIYSRFNLDKNFSDGDFERLYSQWLKSSIQGIMAKKVYIYEYKTKIVGFITLDYKESKAHIGLIAVDKEYRGKGIGKHLIAKVDHEAACRGKNLLEVATQQKNQPAINLYLKTGFELKSRTFIYHLWKK